MSAWTILTGNSIAPNGSTAWIHLNSQEGESGDTIVGGILFADMTMTLEAEIGEVLSTDLLMTELSANILDELSAEVHLELGANI